MSKAVAMIASGATNAGSAQSIARDDGPKTWEWLLQVGAGVDRQLTRSIPCRPIHDVA